MGNPFPAKWIKARRKEPVGPRSAVLKDSWTLPDPGPSIPLSLAECAMDRDPSYRLVSRTFSCTAPIITLEIFSISDAVSAAHIAVLSTCESEISREKSSPRANSCPLRVWKVSIQC